MLSELTRDQFEELWAAGILDCWAGDWGLYPAGLVAAEVHNASLRQQILGGLEVEDEQWKTAVDFLPRDAADAENKPEQTVDDMEALCKAAYG